MCKRTEVSDRASFKYASSNPMTNVSTKCGRLCLCSYAYRRCPSELLFVLRSNCPNAQGSLGVPSYNNEHHDQKLPYLNEHMLLNTHTILYPNVLIVLVLHDVNIERGMHGITETTPIVLKRCLSLRPAPHGCGFDAVRRGAAKCGSAVFGKIRQETVALHKLHIKCNN